MESGTRNTRTGEAPAGMSGGRGPAGPVCMIVAAAFLFCLALAHPVLARPSLCDTPLTYRIGTVDERFKLSPGEAQNLVRQACAVWRKAYSCDLFREDPRKGVITINFIYDERQEKLNTYKTLDAGLESGKKSRKDLATILEAQKADLEKKKQALANDWKGYESRYNILDVRSRLAKMQPQLSEKDRQYFATEPPAMRTLYKELESRGQDLRNEEKKLQSLSDAISRMDDDVKKHQDLEKSLDEPMAVGVYARLDRYRVINVYLCLNEQRVVRTIAHELGHALGLDHSKDPESVMFWMDASDNMEITRGDLEALKKAFKGFD